MAKADPNEVALCLDALARAGVRFVIKTEWQDNKPVRSTLFRRLVITKRDRFYRLNGKIVSRNLAAWASRLNLVALAA